MNVDDWLAAKCLELESAGIGTARLDALVLLEDVTGKNRGWLLAHPEFELSRAQTKKLEAQMKRRASHEPLAYIRNKTEFYGREFCVDHTVLEPRPESETMIELLKQLKIKEPTIVDVGTGSGALAITAKLELPGAEVIGGDIDKNCLEVANRNAEMHGVKVSFLPSDLLSALEEEKLTKNTVLLCNLPYVPDDFHINPAAMREPRIAIFGGSDGLDLYRRLFEQIDELKTEPSFVLTEAMPPQHEELAKIAQSAGYELAKSDDFIQLFTPVET